MKTTIKLNERITFEIEYTTDIITRTPWGFEPMQVEELVENIKYRCFNPSSKVFKSSDLCFVPLADVCNPSNYRYDSRIANAYKNRNDVDYLCRMGQDIAGVSAAEKERIEQAIIELKYAELKESGHFEAKQKLMIKELSAKLKEYQNDVKHAEKEIERTGHLMTQKEIKAYTYKYNNMYNDGYQEPLPFVKIAKETYEIAIEEIERISKRIAEIRAGILW